MSWPGILAFALKSLGVGGLLYGWYFLFLRNQSRFGLNRVFLLGAGLLSVIIPLLDLRWAEAPLGHLPQIWLDEVVIGASVSERGGGLDLPGLIYGLGLALTGGLLLWRMGKLILRIMRAPKERKAGYCLIRTGGKMSTASFLGYLFWDENQSLSPEEEAQMLAHELCHLRQKHSIDLIFQELLGVVLWFNPFVYLLRYELKQTHEFLADQAALAAGGNESYARLMLSRLFPGQSFVLSHSFFQSPIKRRIIMMKKKSPRLSLLAYVLALPLCGGLVLLSCNRETPSEPQPDRGEELTKMVKEADFGLETVDTEVEFGPEGDANLESAAENDPDPNEFVMLDKEPQPLNLNEVVKEMGYPDAAKKAEIEGKVILRLKVSKEGQYLSHIVIKNPNPILTKHVEGYVSKLKFSPGMKDGKAMTVWVTIPFAFQLPQD